MPTTHKQRLLKQILREIETAGDSDTRMKWTRIYNKTFSMYDPVKKTDKAQAKWDKSPQKKALLG